MENVEGPSQPSITLRKFLEDYRNKLTYESTDHLPFYFKKYSSVPADIESSCSLQMLSSPDDNLIKTFDPGAEIQRPNVSKPQIDGNEPKTYTAINEHKARSRHNPFTRTQYSYRLIAEPTVSADQMMQSLDDFELEITVRFYRPPRAAYRGYKIERPVFAKEFVCLGSNYLTDLRDKVSCICNGMKFVDISDDPDAPLPVLETDPGYFFINDTFYNDTRNPKNCDYSQSVLSWAKNAHGVHAEQFKCASMEATRFIDLTVRLGAPQQYLHHGNCEHLFVISQVEVLLPFSKCIDRNMYPFMRAFNTFNRRTCYMCGQRGYHFIVEQSRRQLHDPSYLCRSCFFSFNYVDGKKVGQFKAYRIYDLSEQLDDETDCQHQDQKQDDISSSEEDTDLDGLCKE